MFEKVMLNDIAGYENVKKEARKIITILKNYGDFVSKGVDLPAGIIFNGKPGVGKTLFAKAIACESGVNFVEIVDQHESSKEEVVGKIKKSFEKAKKSAPCILFIDEIDEMVSNREFESDNSRAILKVLLTEIDGLDKAKGVIVIATTNARHSLPKSLIRSGRLEKSITIEMPNVKTRDEILKLYLSKNHAFKNISSFRIASKTDGMSGADLKRLVNTVLINCLSENKEIETRDFYEPINEIKLHEIISQDNDVTSNSVIYHEIGHFVLSFLLTGEIGAINLNNYVGVAGCVESDEEFEIPFGLVTKKIKDKDDWTLSNGEDRICCLLAGYAAERVFVGDVSFGSSSDIYKARHLFLTLCSCGLYGFDYLPMQPRDFYEGFQNSELSNARREKIENLESETLTKLMTKAEEILRNNKQLVDKIYNELQTKRRLEKEELEEMV